MFNDITENEVGEVNEEIAVSGIYEQLLLASFPTSWASNMLFIGEREKELVFPPE